MLSARSSVALMVAALSCLLLPVPLLAEYDIMTRYDVPRPEGGRHFWLYSPSRYQQEQGGPLPLVLFFHGFTDTCELQGYISQFSIWAYVAELHQYHIAVMCGTNPGPGWNSGSPIGNRTAQPDDVAYTRAALRIIQQAVKVRDGHVFAMGHSNGAMMSELLTQSELLACNASDIITAIASNAGTTMLAPSINASLARCSAAYGSNTTSILKLHGTADQAVIYNGTATFPGAVADLQAWGERNHCDGPMHKLWSRGIATAQGWTTCAGGTEVELVSLTGVNHQWLITSDFQSSSYVFDFFNRVAHRRKAAQQAQQ